MKRIISIVLLIIVMLCPICSINAATDSATKHIKSGDYYYSLVDDENIEIYKYIGQDEDVVIPSSINGLTVISLSPYTFKDANKTKSVVVPDTVTKLRFDGTSNGPFSSLAPIERIKMSKNVTEICDYAFNYCQSLKSIEGIENVEIIGAHAFGACGKLDSIVFGDKLKSIGESAFWNCGALKEINLPDSLETVGEKAFLHCDSIKSVRIPKGTSQIGKAAFGYSENSYLPIAGFYIEGYNNTEAQEYAQNNGFGFVSLDTTIAESTVNTESATVSATTAAVATNESTASTANTVLDTKSDGNKIEIDPLVLVLAIGVIVVVIAILVIAVVVLRNKRKSNGGK